MVYRASSRVFSRGKFEAPLRENAMSLKERLGSGKFVVVAELQPPKGNRLTDLLEQADRLRGRVDVIHIPDLQNAIMRLGSLSVCTLLKARGTETIFTLSCAIETGWRSSRTSSTPLPWGWITS